MNCLGNVDLPALFGLRIITRPIPHQMVQAKTHRRKRLNKKWLKRYGYKSVVAPYDRFEVLMMGSTVYAFPEGIEAINEALDKANQEALQRDEKTMLTGVAKSVAPSPLGILNKPLTMAEIRSAIDEVLGPSPERDGVIGRQIDLWGYPVISLPHTIKASPSD